MAQLRHDYQKFVDAGSEVIAIGPEGDEAFKKWWYEHDMPFVGIADPNHTIANLYSQKVKWLKGGRMPALVVVDKDGRVRLSHYADSPSDIPSDDSLLSLLSDLNQE